MGARAQVKIVPSYGDEPIYLYTHWQSATLQHTVAEALAHAPDRWDDESYLAAIIFRHMIACDGGDLKEKLGLGIDTYGHGDAEYTIVVDIAAKEVTVRSGEVMSFHLFSARYAEDSVRS